MKSEARSSSKSSPSRTWKRPKQDRSLERFNRILNTAGRLLDEGGIENLTIERVAAEAETSVGSVYHFFKDRDALISALIDRFSEKVATVFAVSPAALELTPEEAVLRMFNLLLKTMDQYPGFKSCMTLGQSIPEIRAMRHKIDTTFLQMSEFYLMQKYPHIEKKRRLIISELWQKSIEHMAVFITQCPGNKRNLYVKDASVGLAAFIEKLAA